MFRKKKADSRMKNKTLFSVLRVLLVSLLFSPNVFSQALRPPVLTGPLTLRVVSSGNGEPSSSVALPEVGEQFSVDVIIENADAVGYQVVLEFDPTALTFVKEKFEHGDFLPQDETFFGGEPRVQELGGKQRIRFAATSSPHGAIGEGTLATLTFQVKEVKASVLILVAGGRSSQRGTLLSDKEGALSFPIVRHGKAVPASQIESDAVSLPEDLIFQDVAYSPNLTYFVLNAQFPMGSYRDQPSYRRYSCNLKVHLPEDTITLVFPLKAGIVEGSSEKSGWNFLGYTAGKIPFLGDILSVLAVAQDNVTFIEAENAMNIALSFDDFFGTGRTAETYRILYLFLMTKEVTKIRISMDGLKYFDDDKYNWHYEDPLEGTWNLEHGFWEVAAAPPLVLPGAAAARQTTLSDWAPFQSLSSEAQQQLLELSELLISNLQLPAFANAEAWRIPEETSLLSNYPNPFNPETWIPYQLATPADVTLTIYDIHGRGVRTLDLGHQRAGVYQSRSRAAYWDGKNAQGEPVASGIYFYTLSTGNFTATRKMLIRK